MARAEWPLKNDRPTIEIEFTIALGGPKVRRTLLADTGAGSRHSPFELLLDENDCLLAGGKPTQSIPLGGAYRGTFPLYLIRVQIPLLGFDDDVPAIGASSTPTGLDGVACFCFLNRFTYGNFGSANEFGLES